MDNRKRKGCTEKTSAKNKNKQVGMSKAWNSRAENESHSGPEFYTSSPLGSLLLNIMTPFDCAFSCQ